MTNPLLKKVTNHTNHCKLHDTKIFTYTLSAFHAFPYPPEFKKKHNMKNYEIPSPNTGLPLNIIHKTARN